MTRSRLLNILSILFWVVVAPAALTTACDSTTTKPALCEVDRIYCAAGVQATCTHPAGQYAFIDCASAGQTCVPDLGCRVCVPDQWVCDGAHVALCSADGRTMEPGAQCDTDAGWVCSQGRCVHACSQAAADRSYLGCEYWAVDLDNAKVSSGNAAAQQFAVVISNTSLLTARVIVEVDDAPPNWPVQLREVARTEVPPEGLRVLSLPSREVDGSPLGSWDVGTHSALSTRAFRVTSSAPIVAYQFNPLENVDVFSNDASILFPKNALDSDYLVLSWPQTIADTNDPNNDFAQHLRAFVTIVATEPGTNVTVTPSARILGDGIDIPAAEAGQTFTVDMHEFMVLNLETDGFQADLTGTRIVADRPIVVFSGSEASDVPLWDFFAERYCCADHLEHQQFPLSAAGTKFVAARVAPRTPAVSAAGGGCAIIEESDLFRVLALYDGTTVFTSMPAPDDYFFLNRGQIVDLTPFCDMIIESDKPLFVGQFLRGQGTTGIPIDLPGGDPSFIMVPPVEQWRDTYVFLTPDKYAFDFITIAAPQGTTIQLDYQSIHDYDCVQRAAACTTGVDSGPQYDVFQCQLSFPRVYPDRPPGQNVDPGSQNDGYHVLRADRPVMLLVSGFDKHVSYGYVGGMNMTRINVQ
ncbi:IgGFc-binding protein [Myxococcota bacterium]|nr:IgGFc-binding protein [Myxococcota bacterium]